MIQKSDEMSANVIKRESAEHLSNRAAVSCRILHRCARRSLVCPCFLWPVEECHAHGGDGCRQNKLPPTVLTIAAPLPKLPMLTIMQVLCRLADGKRRRRAGWWSLGGPPVCQKQPGHWRHTRVSVGQQRHRPLHPRCPGVPHSFATAREQSIRRYLFTVSEIICKRPETGDGICTKYCLQSGWLDRRAASI